MPGYSMTKDDYMRRLRRIEGQVRGLQRLVDEPGLAACGGVEGQPGIARCGQEGAVR